MPAQVYQVLGLYLVTTVAYIVLVVKANRDMDKKNAEMK